MAGVNSKIDHQLIEDANILLDALASVDDVILYLAVVY